MSSFSNDWQVQIGGLQADLEHLALHFTAPPQRVFQDQGGGGYIYESSGFAPCNAAEEVGSVAEQELVVLSGALKLALRSMEPLKRGAVYRQRSGGGRDVWVFISETIPIRVAGGDVTVTVTGADGKVVTRPSPPPKTLLFAQIAARDPAVAKVLRLQVAPDSDSWVGLYRIYEVIAHDLGGEESFKQVGWGSPQDLKRFTHSANSVAAAGDAARHGRERTDPPKRPMSLEEAIAYIGYVVQSWLSYKGA